jgi:hypothetical protein
MTEHAAADRLLDTMLAILCAAPGLALLAAVTGSRTLAAVAVLTARVSLTAVALAAPAHTVLSFTGEPAPPR